MEFLPVLFMVAGIVLVALATLFVSSLLRPSNPYPEKNMPYECRMDPAGEAPGSGHHAQRAGGGSFRADAPEAYAPGDTVAFDVSSWAMSGDDDVTDDALVVSLGDTELGTAAVDNTVGRDAFDEIGTAAVEVTLPADVAAGAAELTLSGPATGTTVTVPVEIAATAPAEPDVTVEAPAVIKHGKGVAELDVTVTAQDGVPTGTVEAVVDGDVLDSAELADGAATLRVGPFGKGTVEVEVRYSGDATTGAGSTTVTIDVTASGKPGRG
jgi:5'-nucleotidase